MFFAAGQIASAMGILESAASEADVAALRD
jgi:hypothetical protein